MMEIKQNTGLDLNDLMTEKSNGTDEVDDAVMTDLSDRNARNIVNCDLVKANVGTMNIPGLENGDATIESLIKDVDVSVDLNTTVSSELEEALLAEDDVISTIVNSKPIEPKSEVSDGILAEKAESSNSTTSSNNIRDPGDDLDTLLSKINDIVEDCIDNERENTINNAAFVDNALTKIVEAEQENQGNKDTSIIKAIVVNDKSEENTKSVEENLENCESSEDLTQKNDSISLDSSKVCQDLSNSTDVFAGIETKSSNNENKTSDSEIKCKTGEEIVLANSLDKISKKINIEKTDNLNTEIHDKVISNDIKVLEVSKAVESKTAHNGETKSSPKNFQNTEISTPVLNKEQIEITKEKTLAQNIVKRSKGDVSRNLENDESDDEIVFYVDKYPDIQTSKDVAIISCVAEKDIANSTENSISEKETQSPGSKVAQNDEDIVLLLDDEEEVVDEAKNLGLNKKEYLLKDNPKKQNFEEAVLPTGVTAAEEKEIVNDNSDNARDEYIIENSCVTEKEDEKTGVTETHEETNSNCSSSSNLLQEAKCVKNGVEETGLEGAENEEEEDDGDVELIENELKDSETLEKTEDSEISPPQKRMRLSECDEETSKKTESIVESVNVVSLNNIDQEKESEENLEKQDSFVTTHSTLKRSRDAIEVETDDKSNDSKISNEDVSKKIKINNFKEDDFYTNAGGKKETLDTIFVEDGKKTLKAVPSNEPIRLYPAPEILKSELPMSLDFLKKFRKSFDNMTKQDLEELVLQKVVEAIIHRSEFSEMRELIEKQEKLINAHRTKISELSKQFRDLEMVHNRVVKDIEQRNSQFIMPVKITRAVGLQVYIPNKKSIAETTSTTAGTNISSSPQRPVSSQASSISSTSITPPQRQYLSSQAETLQQRPTNTVSSAIGNTGNVRRGCVQKITPIRPVPGTNQTVAATTTAAASAAYRNITNHSSSTQQRILNKSANTTTASVTAIQRSRYLASNPDSQRTPTQQQAIRASNTPTNSQRLINNAANQSKPTSNVVTSVQRRSEPLSSQTATSSTSSIVDNYLNTLSHLTGANTAVSITPAKPKEKAVIDLTDEDEVPGQSAVAQPATHIAGTQVPRRSLPTQSSSSSQLQYGRAAPSLTRVPPTNQMANNKNRQMSSLQAQKNNSFTSISTPPGTSITRINVTPNASSVQRVKYSHPAPLPATPPQAFNPAWKLPPPRPTIRISNLDNGIVISWTMEESMDRHAECVSYQIYAYQETSGPPMVDSWRHVGDVKAMLLPMAVTLTQFQEGQRYYFAVRAVDCHQRYGPFSLPKTWS